jgi:hypothetical protein
MTNDKRLNIITKYYYYTVNILKDYIKNIPTLKLTNAKKYYGQYNLTKNIIKISKWNHVDSLWLEIKKI